MFRLLLCCLLLLAATLHAEEWRSDTHGVAVTMPADELWQQGNAARLPAGDVIFRAEQTQTHENIFIAVLPLMPSNDIENPAVLSRIMETMKASGFTIAGHTPITWMGRSAVELTGAREDPTLGTLVCLVRAALKQNTVYMAIAMGPGSEEHMKTPHFQRVIDTFQFVDPTSRAPLTSNPLFSKYRMAFKIFVSCAGLLAVVLVITLFQSRRRAYH